MTGVLCITFNVLELDLSGQAAVPPQCWTEIQAGAALGARCERGAGRCDDRDFVHPRPTATALASFSTPTGAKVPPLEGEEEEGLQEHVR